jgi:hypothetical protein
MATTETTESINVRYEPSSVAQPKNSAKRTTGLILLSLVVSPAAIYLDGGSSLTVAMNFLLWLNLLWIISVPLAIGYILRSQETRGMARPCRYRLWVRNGEGYAPHCKAIDTVVSTGENSPNAGATFNHQNRADVKLFKDLQATT